MESRVVGAAAGRCGRVDRGLADGFAEGAPGASTGGCQGQPRARAVLWRSRAEVPQWPGRWQTVSALARNAFFVRLRVGAAAQDKGARLSICGERRSRRRLEHIVSFPDRERCLITLR